MKPTPDSPATRGRVHLIIDSPIDPLTLVSDGTHLVGVYMQDHRHTTAQSWGMRVDDAGAPAVLTRAATQLNRYFEDATTTFELPLAPAGTPFQQRVWQELTRIPLGSTISYAELAARTGSPGAARAVGLANGRNPLSIVVPCHRVIGAGGAMTGYGGGLARKEYLLRHEGVLAATSEQLSLDSL